MAWTGKCQNKSWGHPTQGRQSHENGDPLVTITILRAPKMAPTMNRTVMNS